MENKNLNKLPDLLIPWYDQNKRELPWRQDRDPYHIWVSEIMLQQTRVEAVKGYYARFIQELPDVESLSKVPDDRLHKLWEGLGYYSRVRNLKKAAITIMQEHGGKFPKTYDQVRALQGIGDYTAGAVCSIAYNLPTPAVDGNVLRLLSRLLNDPTPIDTPAFKKKITQLLAQIYPNRAGDFTQALMELGATICGPNTKPDCAQCPCSGICTAFQVGTAAQLPVKRPKASRKTEEMTVFILRADGKYALQKRPNKGLLASLWQFPNIPGKMSVMEAIGKMEELGLKPKEIYRQVEKKHIFTHIEWVMNGIYVEVSDPCGDFSWFTAEKINAEAALPTAFRQFWEDIL